MLILVCATTRECESALGLSATSWPHCARIANHEVVADVIGVGPIAAALRMGALLERLPRAQGVINLGICGSFDLDRLPLGSVCVADAEIWPEYGVRGAAGESPEPFGFQMLPEVTLDPPNRLDLNPTAAAAAMGLALPAEWATGPSLTVAGVSGDKVRAGQLHDRYQAATENMEGFSLALAARSKGLPFLEIRTVSNQVGARDKASWNFKAALRALATILPTLRGSIP